MSKELINDGGSSSISPDFNLPETEEWIQSLDEIVKYEGRSRGQFILKKLIERAHELGVKLPFNANTPYINSIPLTDQPAFPGDREIERKIKQKISS